MLLEGFDIRYKLTERYAVGSRSALNDACETLPELLPGVYNSGELTLLADSFDLDGFATWPDAFWKDRSPLAITVLGDFFVWTHRTRRVEFVEVQRQKVMRAADDPGWFLETLLTSSKIRTELLRVELIAKLVERMGPLSYAKCFILQPWQMLGGRESLEYFDIGDVEVYVNLVGQTAFAR